MKLHGDAALGPAGRSAPVEATGPGMTLPGERNLRTDPELDQLREEEDCRGEELDADKDEGKSPGA